MNTITSSERKLALCAFILGAVLSAMLTSGWSSAKKRRAPFAGAAVRQGESNYCRSLRLARDALRDLVEFGLYIEAETDLLKQMLDQYDNLEKAVELACPSLNIPISWKTCNLANTWQENITEIMATIYGSGFHMELPPEVLGGLEASAQAALLARSEMCAYERE